MLGHVLQNMEHNNADTLRTSISSLLIEWQVNVVQLKHTAYKRRAKDAALLFLYENAIVVQIEILRDTLRNVSVKLFHSRLDIRIMKQ